MEAGPGELCLGNCSVSPGSEQDQQQSSEARASTSKARESAQKAGGRGGLSIREARRSVGGDGRTHTALGGSIQQADGRAV